MNKRQAQKIHAKMRCWERLGAYISNDVLEDLIKKIQSGTLLFLERCSNRVSKWKADINGVPCVIVYDKNRKNIVTIWKYDEVETDWEDPESNLISCIYQLQKEIDTLKTDIKIMSKKIKN